MHWGKFKTPTTGCDEEPFIIIFRRDTPMLLNNYQYLFLEILITFNRTCHNTAE